MARKPFKKFPKNKVSTIRVNQIVFAYIAAKGMTPQRIVDDWVDAHEPLQNYLKRAVNRKAERTSKRHEEARERRQYEQLIKMLE